MKFNVILCVYYPISLWPIRQSQGDPCLGHNGTLADFFERSIKVIFIHSFSLKNCKMCTTLQGFILKCYETNLSSRKIKKIKHDYHLIVAYPPLLLFLLTLYSSWKLELSGCQ